MTMSMTVMAERDDHTLRHRIPIREYSDPGVWVRCAECGSIHFAEPEASDV